MRREMGFMTSDELRSWIWRRGLSHPEAASLLALSVSALRKNLYEITPVGKQTARITELIDRLVEEIPVRAESLSETIVADEPVEGGD